MSIDEKFFDAQTTQLSVGLLLCSKDSEAAALRITHIFAHRIYVMAYTTPEAVRTARKPRRLSRAEVQQELNSGLCRLCKVELPQELFRSHADLVVDADEPKESSAAKDPVSPALTIFRWIEPLIKQFDGESNLARHRFAALIQARADEVQMNFLTLWRLVLRFYYFGRVPAALTPLVTGPEAGIKTGTTARENAWRFQERSATVELLN